MASKISLTPLSSLKVSTHQIPSHNLIPNTSPHNHPLYIYHSAFPRSTSPSTLESHLKSVGVATPQWRYTMYSQSHYHSTTHEILLPFSGRATLLFGGDDNPHSIRTTVSAGDVIIVPAGVAHRLVDDLSEGSGGFEMVGAYPKGCSWDMCYGREGEEAKARAVGEVGWLERDPVYGDEGPLVRGEGKGEL